MLTRAREQLTILLLVLLPLHAFGVTVLTKLFAGSGSAPLSLLAVWKEVLLLIILLIAVTEIVREKAGSGWRVAGSKFDVIDVLILLALLYSVLLHPWGDPNAERSYLYGFRYDFVPLVAFLILRRVSWSTDFFHRSFTALMIMGALVSAYGLLTLFFPDSVFSSLGYSLLHSLYQPDAPIAAFQQIAETGIRRVQSTFSGPNQMGLWLLIPVSIALVSLKSQRTIRGWRVAAGALILFAILFTFSRSAWIGTILIGILLLGPIVRRRVMTLGLLVLIVVGILAMTALPSIFVRSVSNSNHIVRPIQAMHIISDHPLGLGLGSAGPANNRTSDTCVELPAGSDASWAESHPDLCVIVGGTQVQPQAPCNCPVLPENWYLQWGVEMGLFGFFVSLALVLLVLGELKLVDRRWNTDALFAAFLGVSVAGLFLHAFEDSAVSYTLWILLSATLPLWKGQTAPSSSSISADSTRT